VGSIVAWLLVVGCVVFERYYHHRADVFPFCKTDSAEGCPTGQREPLGVFGDDLMSTMVLVLVVCLVLGIVAARCTVACVRQFGVIDRYRIRTTKAFSGAAAILALLIALETIFSTFLTMSWPR
jgi:hypothetical protein